MSIVEHHLMEFEPLRLAQETLPYAVGSAIYEKYGKKVSVEFPSPKTEGQWELTSQGWVGFIPVTPECHLRLVPKTPLGNLFRMFEYAYSIWVGDDYSFVTGGEYSALVVDRVARLFDGVARFMLGVWGSSRSDVFMVGAGRITHFDGDSCQAMVSPTTSTLKDVWGRSSTEVYAVGDGGTILRYNGQVWQPMESHTSESLYAVWGNSGSMYVVGGQGTILCLENSEWVPMNSPTTATLTGVWGSSDRDVFAVGQNVTLHYDGSRWEVLSDTIGGKQVWGRSSDEVYVVDGARVLRYGTR